MSTIGTKENGKNFNKTIGIMKITGNIRIMDNLGTIETKKKLIQEL